MSSIRRRLLWALLLGIGVLLCAAALAVYAEIGDEVDELFDAQLQQTAYAFPRFDLPDTAPAPRGHDDEDDDDSPLNHLVVEVRKPGAANVLYHTRTRALLPADATPGWSTRRIAGVDWRLYRTELDGRSVEVGQPLSVRQAATGEIAVQTLLPLAATLPLAALLIWLGIGRGLRPLERTAADIARRSHTDLTPLPRATLPRELLPLVEALDALMARLARALSAQKAFVADAAHELLTPLTALQLQLQLLDRAGDAVQRGRALVELRAGLDRAIHLARQLLTLARQAPERAVDRGQVDLSALARQVVTERAALARARDVDLGLAGQQPALVTADAEGLRALLGNLVDNAVKYTPAGGRVDVSVSLADGAPCLQVADSGPGIPADELSRVFDRFYRRPGQAVTGSGLGLAIARSVAERHGLQLTLTNGSVLGGVLAECRWPVPQGMPKAQ